MAAFNFFETILLVSLAITFVLILFLVYHFKDRITTTEEKTDTMFDIINNMAQEMTNIRTTMNMVNKPPTPVVRIPSFTKIDVSDEENDSDYETDSDEEGDCGSDEEGDCGSDEEDDSGSDEDTVNDNDEEQIKHISMNLDNKIDDQINSDDVNSDNNDIDEKEQPPAELNDSTLVVEKLDELINHVEEDDNESLDEKITYSHSNYRKMNLATLRQMMATRGFSTDTSKMKKNDIISLLENNE